MKKRLTGFFSNNTNGLVLFIIIVVIVMHILTLFMLFRYRKQADLFHELEQEQNVSYDKRYAFISQSEENTLWNAVYQELRQMGEEQNIYIERLTRGLPVEYSKAQLLEIAIASGVDGIIVEADESEETKKMINTAQKKGIPVITLLTDNPNTMRKSYVGVSNFNLGQEYSNLIYNAAEQIYEERMEAYTEEEGSQEDTDTSKSEELGNMRVLVLIEQNTQGTNMIYSAITENLENLQEAKEESPVHIETETAMIRSANAFSAEESIRDTFQELEQMPDIVVCMNEQSTLSVYQMLVDQNKVGQTQILGYYDSEMILKAVERKAIYATIMIDTKQMAHYCMDALNEYIETGYVSEYFAVDFTVIDGNNIQRYLRNEEENGEET